ncbi:fimbrial biogenesis chaperone [Solimonas terrae]|uniref:Molecular chaperone n=1 Tax=Solimonas terrae TaxID=1396819 RepID=A0A6M2BP84_9GAMM|nr:fimbria/pilus periplasmic chaperone [Solimonas terrae]NGY04416.1 molecular chaperone [Solimonas terrae]
MHARPGGARIGTGLLAGLLLLLSMTARAGGLGVSPILLEFDARSPARALWLTNAGDHVLHGQVRVFRWTQENGEDRLTPTRELVVSPPMVEIAPGSQQLVRVIRATPYPAGEQAYRILVNELPDTSRGENLGLSFVMEFSVPVFVGDAGTPAQLSWNLRKDNDQVVLEARNRGGTRAQVSAFALLDAHGKTLMQEPGLLGYALAGQLRRWTLKLPAQAAADAQILQARINGEPIRVDLRAHDATP